jgi:hypothetical protein
VTSKHFQIFLTFRGLLESYAWVDDILWDALLEQIGYNTS